MSRSLAWSWGACGILFASSALAEDGRVGAGEHAAPGEVTWHDGSQDEVGPPHAAPEPVSATRWYGWQILVADASSVLIGLAALKTESDPLVALTLLGYAAAPPIIHSSHEQRGRALLSFGMRLTMPMIGALVAGVAAPRCYDEAFCEFRWAGQGALIGMAATMLIDAAFAHEPNPAASAGLNGTAPRAAPQSFLAPQVFVSERETRVVLAGSF